MSTGATLKTVKQVVDAVGGSRPFRDLTGASHQKLWNWKDTNRLPPPTYLILQGELAAKGRHADPSLWGVTGGAKPRHFTRRPPVGGVASGRSPRRQLADQGAGE